MPRLTLLLASQSPRRLELLRMLGYEVIVKPADVDESGITADSPAALTERLARLKAEAIAATVAPDHPPIVAADTLVELNGEILGKPKDKDDAHRMLAALSGQTHAVHTGLALVYRRKTVSLVETAAVRFRPLHDDEIRDYVNTGHPMDKAGAYGIQGPAGAFVERIEGDYFTIVGLPLCHLVSLLQSEFGLPIRDQ
ncbi:MAG: septum formation inhibitor Maf [Ruminococcaceae bacterium]|nr:septum formation inhibitor Maf [Oscillospiraceae bacterium]